MTARVKLLALDFGTTTSSAVVAEAVLAGNAVTGRTDLGGVREVYRSEMAFTPHRDGRLDLGAIDALLTGWLRAGQVEPGDLFGGGALLTGLTARRENADALVRLIRARVGDALIATADDPCLESWLAFMGSCVALSRALPARQILNLDIGGGTTNLALGLGGEVLRTGCLFVGARHVRVEPGTYRIVELSAHARALLDQLAVRKGPGDELTSREVESILDFYLNLLGESAGAKAPAVLPAGHLHTQVPFRPPEGPACVITVSGGVGELVYAFLDGVDWPPTTHFGDLGIDLARRIVGSPWWGERLRRHRPASAGRATAYGLLRHATEVSGSTLFLPDPALLPLNDLPIVGTVDAACTEGRVDELLALAGRGSGGACLRVELPDGGTAAVRRMGQALAAGLRRVRFDPSLPLVLLVRENAGKTLGHYVTEWGALPCRVVVIDEVPARDAQFARLGRVRRQVVPVSYYGLR